MEEPEKKRIRVELPLEVDNLEESHEKRCEENCEESSSSVSLHYDILRIIFQFLNGRDLSSVAMVCRSWLEAANKEKSLRKGPHCFLEKYMSVDVCASHTKSSLGKNKALAFLQSLTSENLNRIKEISIKPLLGFFFFDLEIPHDATRYICELLPKNCETIVLYTESIILNNEEMEYQRIRDVDPFPNIVCAFLPQISNVKISMVVVTDPILKEDKCAEYVRMIEGAHRRDHETSTCLMLFCNCYGFRIGCHMASLAKDERIVSFWGGIVEGMQTNNEGFLHSQMDKKSSVAEPYCVAILITGAMQTWSIVVDKKCKTKQQIEEKLKYFKEQVKLQKYSVGFMFACKARGVNMYHEKNVESTIFKRLFPEVPLVGCFGNGEFGKDTTVYKSESDCKPEHSSRDQKECKNNLLKDLKFAIHNRCKSELYNEFSTIFMILTYG